MGRSTMNFKRILYRIWVVGLVLGLAGPGFGLGRAAPVQAAGLGLAEGEVEVLQSSASELLLTVNAPRFELVQAASLSGPCQILHSPDWPSGGPAGQPELPARGLLVGLPVQGEPSVRVETALVSRVIEGVELCPAESWSADGGEPGQLAELQPTRARVGQAYAANRDYPGSLAEIASSGMLRSQRVGKLGLHPFQYNPLSKRLTVYGSLRVRVAFNASPALSLASAPDEGPYEAILQESLLNYAEARSWRTAPAALLSPARAAFDPAGGQSAYRIALAQDGIYRVSYADLAAAGIPAATLDSLDPRTFQLFNGGNEVSLWVEGANPAVFGAVDGIIFYGQKNNTRYSDTNIYWLTWGGANGQRMATSDGSLGAGTPLSASFQTVRAEQNPYYIQRYPNGPDHDHWYWDILQAYNANKVKEYTLNLSNVSANPAGSAVLRGLLRDYSSVTPQHTRISLNGQLVKEETWPANSDYAFEVSVPQALLLNGANTIKVEVVLDPGINLKVALVNWFEIGYTRDNAASANALFLGGDGPGTWQYTATGFSDSSLAVLDISAPLHPLWIEHLSATPAGAGLYDLAFQQTIASPRQYAAFARSAFLAPLSIQRAQPADLRSGSNGADMIIIAPPEFFAALQPLVDFHAAQGLRTRLVSVQDIYDEFSAGIFDPQAIHDFLTYTYANWSRPAPSYVLLAGDGHFDYKNLLLTNEPNYVPPYLADVDLWIGEVPIDNYYVSVSGGDILPDMAVGRLPLKSAVEAGAAVAKILAYAQAPLDPWTAKALFVADAVDPSAGNFVTSSDQATAYLPASMTVDKVYYKVTQPTLAQTTSAILSAINGGRLIVNYVGHASRNIWSNDTILSSSQIASLTNTAQPSFFLSMACYLGYFAQPSAVGGDSSSFDELLVRKASGGAIAAFSPAGWGLVGDHDLLDQGVFETIDQNHITEFGRITTRAKIFMYANTVGDPELVDTYLLFGDPALRIKMDSFRIFLPSLSK